MDATTASFGLNKATTRKRPAAFRCSKMMAWPNEAKEALRVRWADGNLTNERVTDDFANIGRLICTAYGATYRGRDG